MTFGEKLSKLRKENNYTQEQLAELLDVSRQTVSKWELDIMYPETEKLIEIGKLFACSMDYLLKEEIEDKNDTKASVFSAKMHEIGKKAMSDDTKRKAKKIFKIAGLVLLGIVVIDVISMIVYFSCFGLPH